MRNHPPLRHRLHASLPLLLTLLSVLCGCENPYLTGYTGDRLVPLAERSPVEVYGVNRADPVAIDGFNDRLNAAKTARTMLGSSTIVSANPLRDEVAAQAGREVGATYVLYSFAYLNSTVESDTDEYYRSSPSGEYERFERRTRDTTRHWYEYRAYFFTDGPPNTQP